MELDPQPDYKLFHHMAAVSPVTAIVYNWTVLKKKEGRYVNFQVFFTLSSLAPLHFIICATFSSSNHDLQSPKLTSML